MPVDAAGVARSRLAWHCRRGTRELDLLLQRWLERCYEGCDASQRALFEALLELPDPELADYLLAGARPAQPELGELVEAIRGLATACREMPGKLPLARPAGYNKSDN